ncbi:substrate-binding domain-containing protein [Glycomyces halotolerans]
MVFGHTRAVKSHRTGRRRKKGGARLPVAPWIVITLACVLVASALTAGYVMLLRAGCGGDTYRVSVVAAGNIHGTLDDLAAEWERGAPELDGQCVGVEVHALSAVEASRGLTGEWDTVSLGPRPIAWVPDSDVWPEWVTGTEATADLFSSEPVVLGQSKTVLAVPEPVAGDLGWLGGQPPSWDAVLEASESGEVRLAAANPRTSTEGLQSMLNAVSDGSGGVDLEAMERYNAAIERGQVAESAEALFSAWGEAEDPGSFANVFTALDYQVADFNAGSDLEFELVPITPSGTGLDAVYPYLVLDGAGWVSPSDAAIGGMFGEYLQTSGALSEFADDGVAPVADGGASQSPITGETVREAVRQWQLMRRDLHVLVVVDRSAGGGSQTVEYGGEQVAASDAQLRLAVSFVRELGSTSRAGLWEFGVGAGEGNRRSVVESAELGGDHAESLESALWSLGDAGLYPGGSPLFDTVTAAYDYMAGNYVDGADNVIVVLTANGVDEVSAPTIEETTAALVERAAEQSGPVSVYTVGFGDADVENLTSIAEATGGSYIPAPSSGGLVAHLRERLVN